MNSALLIFPGMNREKDMARAVRSITGKDPLLIWHNETELPKNLDLAILPGGFSYGDYLRCGAIAARSPIMGDLRARARHGLKILGICNGFQILTEAGLLPGILMRNKALKFTCRLVQLRVENNQTFFTNQLEKGTIVSCPVAHGEGNYHCDQETLIKMEDEGRIVFRYANDTNPNGASHDIAGIINEQGNIIGMMPHPENMIEPLHYHHNHANQNCRALFESLVVSL